MATTTYFFRLERVGNNWKIDGFSKSERPLPKARPTKYCVSDLSDRDNAIPDEYSTLAKIESRFKSMPSAVPWVYIYDLRAPGLLFQAVTVFDCEENAKQWRANKIANSCLYTLVAGHCFFNMGWITSLSRQEMDAFIEKTIAEYY